MNRWLFVPFLVWLLLAPSGWYLWATPLPESLENQLKKGISMRNTHTDSSIQILIACNKAARKQKQWLILAKTYKELGIVYAESGLFKEAAGYADTAAGILQKLKEPELLASVQNLQGNVLMRTGDSKAALRKYLECMANAELVHKKSLLLMVHSNISMLYTSLFQYEKALEYGRKQYALAVSMENKDEIGYACAPIIDVFSQLHMPDSMEKYVRIMEKAIRGTSDNNLPLMLANETGSMYNAKRQYKKAIPHFQKAVKLNEILLDEPALYQSYLNLGMAYQYAGQIPMAIKNVLLTFNWARKQNDKMLERESCKVLATAYASVGDFKKAYEYQADYQALSDQALNQQNQEAIQKLEARFQNEKTRDALRLLHKDNILKATLAKRRKDERNLAVVAGLALIGFGLFFGNRYVIKRKIASERALLEERLRISHDLHDEVGSSLSSLQIFGKVAENLLSRDPEKAREILQQINLNSQTTINNLSDIVWAMKENPHQYSIEARIQNYAAELLEAKEIKVDFRFQVPLKDIFNSIDNRKNALLFLKEAIHNAAKYSEAQLVEIFMNDEKTTWVLGVKDNGQGFAPDQISSGNGMVTMRKRCSELGGKFEMITAPGMGCVATCVISKNSKVAT